MSKKKTDVARVEPIVLLPCPFSGSASPEIIKTVIGEYTISCNGPIECPGYLLRDECIAESEIARRWNTRSGQ